MIPKNTLYVKWREIFLSLFARKDEIELFEKKFCQLTKRQYSLALPYNRMGIYLSCVANNWKNKDILMPAYTCVVVANAIICSGNNPIFVDIDPLTYNMDLEDVKRKLTSNTAAVIPTHMYGCPMDIRKLKNILPKNIFIIEDAALSIPGRCHGEDNEMHSDIMIFSLGHNKIITSVDGGIAVFKDYDTYRKIKFFRDAALKNPSVFKNLKIILKIIAYKIFFIPYLYAGINYLRNSFSFIANSINSFTTEKIELNGDWRYKFSRIQAFIANNQLDVLDKIIENRERIDGVYFKMLENVPGVTLPRKANLPYSHFTIRIKNRDKINFRERLYSLGIECGKTLDYCLPDMELFSSYSQKNSCPNALSAAEEIVNLPNYPSLADEKVKFISQKVAELIAKSL